MKAELNDAGMLKLTAENLEDAEVLSRLRAQEQWLFRLTGSESVGGKMSWASYEPHQKL